MQKLKEDVRKKIMNSGAKLFRTKGFENTSMKDIAQNAQISTGNIYRYFLTKHHLLDEIQSEIESEFENFFNSIPSSYGDLDCKKFYKAIKDEVIQIAETKSDDLDVMFKCVDQGLFKDFKNKILSTFTEKIIVIAESIDESKADVTLCGSLARSLFEGFSYIIKENAQNLEELNKNLDIYYKLMIENIDKRILEVLKK